MLGPFLKYCCDSLVLLLFLRIFVLEFVNIMHSIALPSFLVLLFFFFKEKNRQQVNLNQYMLTILLPAVVLISAQKTISQSPSLYYINESFLSWMVLSIFLSVISPLPWYKVSLINACNFLLFSFRICLHYGKAAVRDD